MRVPSWPKDAEAHQGVMFITAGVGGLDSNITGPLGDVRFLVDTGSDITTIDIKTFERLFDGNMPDLEPVGRAFLTANGDRLNIAGCCTLLITIDEEAYPHPVLIAETSEEGLLGVDFLSKYRANINAFDRTVTFGALQKVTTSGSRPRVCKVTAVHDYTVAAGQEALITGLAARCDPGVTEGIVEPRSLCVTDTEYPEFVLAKTLVQCDSYKMVPIRVMNPGDSAVVIQRGSLVGLLHPIACSVTGVDKGDNSDQDPLLQTLIQDTQAAVDEDKRETVARFLMKNRDVFMKADKKLGRCDKYLHDIDTGDALPIKQRAYRLPIHKREEVDRQVRDMMSEGIIEPSDSPWASPIVLVQKRDGSMRFCIDYRKLNLVTKKDAYPLPRIDDSLDALNGSSYFTTLDLASGYWQLGLAEQAKEKTAFTTGSGLYHFNVLPFGLCNAPASFERLMERVLTGLHWKICLVYLDDIIVYASTFEQHLDRLQQVLDCLHSAGLRLKPQKCRLFRTEVLYLGFVVCAGGVKSDPEKVNKVRNWPVPSNVTEVRSFLGLCSYYRKFVKGFSDIAVPLFDLTKKHAKFSWGAECQESFDRLKQTLCEAAVLAYPDFDKPFILDTDASEHSCGAVLSQIQNGEEKVLSYFSTTHAPSELKYSTTRKELLAVIKAVKHFRHYLYGREFTIRTDHASLKWLASFKQPEGQVARWVEFLDTFQYKIEHRSGTKHTNADALSRRPGGCSSVVFGNQWTHSDVEQAQGDDPTLSKVIQLLQEDYAKPKGARLAGLTSQVRLYISQWDQLELHEGLLYRKWYNVKTRETSPLLVIPQGWVVEVLRNAHDAPSGGHLGTKKTLGKLQLKFYWVGMHRDVKHYVRSCRICGANKNPVRNPRAPLVNMGAVEPMERVAIDLLGPFPITDRGNRYILVAGDYYSKWKEAYPLPNQEAKTVAEVLVSKFFSRFGVPRTLHSDQGPNFESRLFQEMCDLLGMRKTRTSPYHPSGDGLVERFNRTLVAILRSYVSLDQSDWDLRLPLVTMAYRSSVQETTGYTPNRLMLGREVNIPLTLMVEPPPHSPMTPHEFVERLRRDSNKAFETVQAHVRQQQHKQKIYYDRKVHGEAFREGDQVWLHTNRGKRGLSPKLISSWRGPFLIKRKLSDLNYVIVKPGSRNQQVVHFNRLKPYYERDRGEDPEPPGSYPHTVLGGEIGVDVGASNEEHIESLGDSSLPWDDMGESEELPQGTEDEGNLETGNPLELEIEGDFGDLPTPLPRRRRRRPPDWMRSGAYDLT